MNKSVLLSAAFMLAAFIPAVAFAEPFDKDFAFHHPARTQVVYRVERIKWLVDRRLHEGDITEHQAKALRAEADGIRGEEIYLASLHNERLTAVEQKKLNWELDGLARQLRA
jgi:hypothetical protein